MSNNTPNLKILGNAEENAPKLEALWGNVIKSGFTSIPNLLLKNQGELNLKAIELNVLINLLRFWWVLENIPFPSIEKLAVEMGMSERTIHRAISSLEDHGYVKKIHADGKIKYDLGGLMSELKKISAV